MDSVGFATDMSERETTDIAQLSPVLVSEPQRERGEGIDDHKWLSCSLHRLTCWPLMAAVFLCVLLIIVGRSYLEQLPAWLENLSLLSNLLVFTTLFTLVSLPFGCGYVMINMAAGYVHGFVEGQVLVVISVAVGFSVAFLLCRSCLRLYAQNNVSPHLLALMRVVEGPNGFKVILLTRLTPIPFGMQNTLFAVSDSLVQLLCSSLYLSCTSTVHSCTL